MNWDSFFSGVSQATASILGIVLAFIISKILSESSNFLDLEEKLKDTLIDSGEINSLSKELKVNWHDEFILKNDASFHALLDATSFGTINNSELELLLREHVPRLFTYEDRAAYARQCEAGYREIRRTSSITTFGSSTS